VPQAGVNTLCLHQNLPLNSPNKPPIESNGKARIVPPALLHQCRQCHNFRLRKRQLKQEIGMQIKNRVFIVTGGASGLGEGAARMLAEQGATVVIADMQVEKGEAVAQEIGGSFVKCDVSQEADGQAAVAKAISLGKLVGLINCAGIAPAEKTVGKNGPHALAVFSKTVTVNLVGTFNMIRLAADAMSKNEPEDTGERGVLISTASVAAYDGQIGQAAYSASKGGVVGMTLPIARDLARSGIRNMTIAPGIFGTPMLFGMPKEVQNALAASVPFPSRLGTPQDYARLAKHIIENDMLNGEVIRLDGAIRLAPR
jgi:NAD(P)-dependent dehydrogenase (short-subunit alcohol dehydrogenase family)